MLDLRRFTPARLFRERTRPVAQQRIDEQIAPPLVLARFRYLQPGGTRARSWAEDLDVSVVMISGTLSLSTGHAGAVLRRDDVVALGPQRHYELANPASGEGAWFVELWMRRDRDAASARPHLHHITADRRQRIRTIVDLLPAPRVSAVILCAGDAVSHQLGPGRAAYVASTVGTVALNDLQISATSAAIVRGPGHVRIRALESSEVLLVPLRYLSRARAG